MAPIAARADLDTMRALYERYGEAWASRDADEIAAHHAEDGIFHLHAGAEAVQGRDAIRDTFAGIIGQFPDIAFDEQHVDLAEWGWVVRWTMSGTLAQPLPVGEQTAEPGAHMSVDAVDVIEVNSDGLLTAKHTYLDALELMRQVGLAQ